MLGRCGGELIEKAFAIHVMDEMVESLENRALMSATLGGFSVGASDYLGAGSVEIEADGERYLVAPEDVEVGLGRWVLVRRILPHLPDDDRAHHAERDPAARQLQHEPRRGHVLHPRAGDRDGLPGEAASRAASDAKSAWRPMPRRPARACSIGGRFLPWVNGPS